MSLSILFILQLLSIQIYTVVIMQAYNFSSSHASIAMHPNLFGVDVAAVNVVHCGISAPPPLLAIPAACLLHCLPFLNDRTHIGVVIFLFSMKEKIKVRKLRTVIFKKFR